MKVLVFQVVILTLLVCLEISFCKIFFEQNQVSAVSLIKHFLQNDIFPDIRNMKVVNFGYDISNPDEFKILIKSLNDKHTEATLTLSDFNETILDQSDNVMLLLLAPNQIEQTFQFIREIALKRLNLISAIIVFSPDFSREKFTKLYDKPQAENFRQIIYAFPSFEIAAYGVPFKVHSGTLVFYLENLLLSKLSSRLQLVKFNTNKWKIHGTLIMLRQQQKHYAEELNTYPMRALIYLRPLSVEKNLPNSTEPFTGIDINILKISAKSMGSPYILKLGKPEEYGNYYANNTPTRTLTELWNGTVDVAINRYPFMKSGQGVMTVPYDHEEFCFIMLMPKNQLRKWSIFMPFKTSVWIFLLLIHIVILVIYMFIREKRWKVIWLFQSAVSATHFPASSTTHRFFWSNWLFFHLIINTCYTSFFVTQIVPQKKQHPYKTIHDLVTRNITFLSEVGHFQEITDSYLDIKLTPYYGNAIHINRNSALLTSYLTRMELFRLYGLHLYMVDECLQKIHVGPLISIRNPNFQSVVRIMQQINAAGLKKYWLDFYLNDAYLSGNNSKVEKDLYEKKEFAPLTVKELESVFNYFCVGLVLSILVFFCEMIQLKITRPRTTVPPEILRVFPYRD